MPLHSIPFSTEDIYMAIPAVDPSEIELPGFVSDYPCAQFLAQHPKLNGPTTTPKEVPHQ